MRADISDQLFGTTLAMSSLGLRLLNTTELILFHLRIMPKSLSSVHDLKKDTTTIPHPFTRR